MDERQIFETIDEATFNMDNSTCDELVTLLNHLEYVVIEDKKTELFKKRINYICLANSFQAAMERDYKMKQICSFLKKYWYFEEKAAQQMANRLNEARRVYKRLGNIVHNCCSCSHVDIRGLTIHELYLANSLSWVIKRSAEVKPKVNVPDNVSQAVDGGSVQNSINEILNSVWYQQAKDDPQLVASILQGISTRVINDSIYPKQ